MAERQPLEVVAQVEPGAPHDGDRAEARIVSAFADHVRNALVSPEQSDLVNEMGEELVIVGVCAGTGRNRCTAVSEDSLVGREAIVLGIPQHIAAIELIQRKRTLTRRQAYGASLEQLL